MFKAKKKPIIVEVILWLGSNWEEINNFLPRDLWWLEDGSLVNQTNLYQPIILKTLEGKMKVEVGDYIIKGVRGEFYPCKPDVFEKTYELVEGKSK